MRIAFDSQIFCGQGYGGASRYFAALASGLEVQGQAVRIFAPWHRNQYLQELPGKLVHGRRLPYCPPRSKRILRPLNAALSAGPMRRWKPDIIHESYYAARGAPAGIAPVVVTVLDMVHELFPDSFSKLDNTSKLKHAAVNRANHVICISENTRKDLVQLWGAPEDKVSVVYLGCDSLRHDDSIANPFLKLGPYLLYVANRGPYKNFTGLLRAYSMSDKLLRDFKLVAFGGGALTREELVQLGALGIPRENVIQVSGDDQLLAQAYTAASVFVYPSFYEGFGLSPLEAMRLGCPVASSNASCLPEVLGEAACYFDPGSTESIISTLERILYDDTQIEMYRARGRERAGVFSWQACATDTLSVYRKVLTDI